VIDVVKTKYKTISIKIETIEMIEKFMKEHPEWGYTSVTEFIRESLRAEMEKHTKKDQLST
jgi:hypothetical protein